MFRCMAGSALALALALGVVAPQLAAAAHHEPVIQVYVVDVEPGKHDKYVKEANKLAGVMKRLGSPGAMRMWNTTAAGPDTGTVMIGVEYPSAVAWAADQPKLAADPEWKKIRSKLPKIRTLASSAVWRDISPSQSSAGPGGVLLVTGVQVKPGKLDDYRSRVRKAQGITKRLGLTGRLRMWHAIVAGPNTGNVAVGIEYRDLATYVSEQAKLAADPEWKKILSGLDKIRTLGGRWLYEEIPPQP